MAQPGRNDRQAEFRKRLLSWEIAATCFAARVRSHSKVPDAATQLIKFLTGRTAIAVIKAQDMDPTRKQTRRFPSAWSPPRAMSDTRGVRSEQP
jgi:hypothetical protein